MDQLGHMTKEDVIKHLVSFEFNRFLDYYKNSRDLNVPDRGDRRDRNDRGERRERGERAERGERSDRGSNDRGSRGSDRYQFTRFHINVGRRDQMNPANLMGFINESLSKRDVEIGKIEIMDTFSFFEIDSNYADKLMGSLKGSEYNEKRIILSAAKSTGPKPKSDFERPAKDKGAKRTSFGNDKAAASRKDRFKGRFGNDRDARGGRPDRASSGSQGKSDGKKNKRKPF
jgi:ATP-dependent RNA helicase DeaD